MSAIRKNPGVSGTPDAIVIGEGEDIASIDSVIDRMAELPEVEQTDSKVARWLK